MKPASTLILAGAMVTLMSLSATTNASPPKPFTEESFAQIRANHAGKPLVVHIWGMTCGPCLTELPKWSELLRKRPDMNLTLIEVDPSPPRVSERTLRQAGLSKVESWGVMTPFDEYLRASIDSKWIGDMPRTLLISPSGEVARIRGVADLGQVSRWLDSWASAGDSSSKTPRSARPANR